MAIIGIDEVGRGCWAGPLVVVGVRLEDGLLSGLKDSKALTRTKREELRSDILFNADNITICWSSPSDIDTYGLTVCMEKSCEAIFSSLFKANDRIIIDGMVNFLKQVPQAETLAKADELVPTVAAASIVAKIARDNYMEAIDVLFPEYGFAQHVGYGTKQHSEALTRHGICRPHRKSFKPIAKHLQ